MSEKSHRPKIDLSHKFPDRLRRAVVGDCGSTQYLSILVTGRSGGHAGNFSALQGKYFLVDPQEEKLEVLGKEHHHLIGTRIWIRSPCTCKYRSEYRFCAVCYGRMSLSLPPEANIGHWSAVASCEIISQAVMSTKHLDGAASMDLMIMTAQHQRHFKRSEERRVGKECRL